MCCKNYCCYFSFLIEVGSLVLLNFFFLKIRSYESRAWRSNELFMIKSFHIYKYKFWWRLNGTPVCYNLKWGIVSSRPNQVDDSERMSRYFFPMVCMNVYSYHYTKCNPFNKLGSPLRYMTQHNIFCHRRWLYWHVYFNISICTGDPWKIAGSLNSFFLWSTLIPKKWIVPWYLTKPWQILLWQKHKQLACKNNTIPSDRNQRQKTKCLNIWANVSRLWLLLVRNITRGGLGCSRKQAK
jgi:hypothetical protein